LDIVARACDAKRGSSKRCLTSIRHLGINVTNYLSPSDHIRDIAAKAHKRASFIHRCSSCFASSGLWHPEGTCSSLCSVPTRLLLCRIGAADSQLKRLQSVHNTAARLVENSTLCPYISLYSIASNTSASHLQDRSTRADVCPWCY